MVANKQWNLNLSVDALIVFAAPFGADIPCFLFGEASLAQGIGDKLMPFHEPVPEGYVLLAYPGTGLSTPAVFQCYDEQLSGGALTPPKLTDTIRAHCGRAIGINDLEACACSLSSEVAQLLEQMRTLSECAWMSGSGSTCVALFDDRDSAEDAARQLREQHLATWTHVGRLLSEHPLKQANNV